MTVLAIQNQTYRLAYYIDIVSGLTFNIRTWAFMAHSYVCIILTGCKTYYLTKQRDPQC